MTSLAGNAAASTIFLSVVSSDETDPAVLDATLDFSVSGTTLTLKVTNDATAPNEYNINEVYWNAASNVTGLTLTIASHSDATAGPANDGIVTTAWVPVLTSQMVDGFGVFDFGLTYSGGALAVNVIGPSEMITFSFSISGTGPFDMTDFVAESTLGFTGAAKFVSGPGDDSAFGAFVPEPNSAVLLGIARWAS